MTDPHNRWAMNRQGHNRRWHVGLLALLLVFAQSAAGAHDFMHAAGGEHDICAACSIGGGLKDITAAPESTFPVPPRSVNRTAQPVTLRWHAFAHHTAARAPPHFS